MQSPKKPLTVKLGFMRQIYLSSKVYIKWCKKLPNASGKSKVSSRAPHIVAGASILRR